MIFSAVLFFASLPLRFRFPGVHLTSNLVARLMPWPLPSVGKVLMLVSQDHVVKWPWDRLVGIMAVGNMEASAEAFHGLFTKRLLLGSEELLGSGH